MGTYTTLIQDIQDYTEDDSTEFVAELPTIVTRAEEALFRVAPQCLEFNKSATGTLTSGTKTLTHGLEIRYMRQMSITSGTNTVFLERRTDSFISTYTPDSTATGIPKFYSQDNSTVMSFAPTPNANFAYKIEYKNLPTGLSTSNDSTWFSTNQYDLLFTAAMVEASKFLQNTEALTLYTQQLADKSALFINETEREYKSENTAGM